MIAQKFYQSHYINHLLNNIDINKSFEEINILNTQIRSLWFVIMFLLVILIIVTIFKK